MIKSACLLGIDVGGTVVKVGSFDADGTSLGLCETPIPGVSLRPGWAEIDPHLWYVTFAAGVRHVVRQGGVARTKVAAIGLSNLIGTVAPLDAAREPLLAAITYYDTRSASEAGWMLQQAPSIPQVAGNRVTPANTSLASILWLQRNEAETYSRAATFAQTNTLLFVWLTGTRRTDWTNASSMGLVDHRTLDWSPDLASSKQERCHHVAVQSDHHRSRRPG